ncbi:MAG: NAD(P)-binding domain-containing protein [Actinomycetota bacterium]
MRVAIVGVGSVGRALAAGLMRTGNEVTIGVRDPGDTARHGDAPAPVASVADAVSGSEVVILAVPFPALGELVPGLALEPGQIVIDATNPVRTPVPAGFATGVDYLGSLLPEGVQLVKAFNTIGAEHLSGGAFDAGAAFLPVAGDEPARGAIAELATEMGFDVADLGGRDTFDLMESHARLWIHLAIVRGWPRDFGFVVARR